ncbi:MAG: cyanophycinase-like exopeptidase [Ilumatobacter sp.]|jgi:cyanophycinase-like exopeptidase
MTALPRLLVIMGSGETAPTMTTPHRRVFEQLAAATGGPVDAVLLDTPFGFQENVDILAAKTAEYFTDAAHRTVEIAGLTRTDHGDVVAIETAIAKIRSADWIFAGPGSPTFALRQWADTPIPQAIADKLHNGGAVVFSSAAALTLGRKTIPVYEVYKSGADPYWVDGLDVLSEVGLPVVVIPHYDNKEGGNHDTSKCYLGERRLALLEPELDDDVFILGVDEHTGVIIDLDAKTAEVVGKGGVTLRKDGVSTRIETGTTVPLGTLQAGPVTPRSDHDVSGVTEPTDSEAAVTPRSDHDVSGVTVGDDAVAIPSLAGDAARLESEFDAALAARDADGAVKAILELDSAILQWSRDTLQGDEMKRARTSLRSMVVRLGGAATAGVRDVREVLGPVVEAALAARVTARTDKAYAVSDAIRDNLIAAGIEVRDTADGAEWVMAD